MKADISYIVSHGFASRMVMQTNLLGLLVKNGLTVNLIAPDKNDENLKTYCEENGIELYEFNPSSNFWSTQYFDARKYFLEDIRNNTALWEKHVYATRFNKSKNPWNHLKPRLLLLCNNLIKWFPNLKNWYKKREQNHLESNEANRLLETIQTEYLVSTYPVNFSEAMLLKAAKNNGIKTIIHLLSWDNISCKGYFPQLSDQYVVWGDIMKEELNEYYNINDDSIFVCGVPHFDMHFENKAKPDYRKHLEKLGLDPEKPYIFYGMSSPRFAPNEIDNVEWLAESIHQNKFGNEMQLIVRPHPQNVQGGMADKSWLPRLNAIEGKRVVIDYPDLVKSKMPWSMKQEDMVRLSQLLTGCSVSINSGSTLSIDALACGAPVILSSFDGSEKLDYWRSARRLIDFPHLKKLISLGGISVANSFEELSELINKYISDPSYKLELRNKTLALQCSNKNELSTSRIANIYTSIIKHEKSYS